MTRISISTDSSERMSQRFFVKSLTNESGCPFAGMLLKVFAPKREADLEIQRAMVKSWNTQPNYDVCKTMHVAADFGKLRL